MNAQRISAAAHDDRGAALALFAILLVALMVMSAFAVDLGLLFNERRQDQSAADTGVLGGALVLGDGLVAASESAARIVRSNLPTDYTDAEWSAAWSACTDPDRYAQIGEVLGVSTNCISYDGSTFRVRLPDQTVDTALLSVIGFQEFQSSAFAEASYEEGVRGVLPFAVLGNAPSGSELCLRAASGGQSLPPCYGSQSGNFGAIEIGQYGDASLGTHVLPCNLNKSDQLTVNIAVGVDHALAEFTGTQVADVCDTAVLPNYLNTFQGISGGTFEGLIAGKTVSGHHFAGHLTTGTTPSRELIKSSSSYFVDNVSLWDYIGDGKAGSVPPGCERESFDAIADHAIATAQLTTCLIDHAAGVGFDPLFDHDADSDGAPDILDSTRFSIVPQFVETTFPNGNGSLHIREFRFAYLNDIYFGCNGSGSCTTIVRPGESSSAANLPNGAGGGLDQVTAHLLPNSSLPSQAQDILNGQPAVQLTR